MWKFDILDNYNFVAPYLLHPKFVLTKVIELDFYSNLVFVVKNFSSIQDVIKI